MSVLFLPTLCDYSIVSKKNVRGYSTFDQIAMRNRFCVAPMATQVKYVIYATVCYADNVIL